MPQLVQVVYVYLCKDEKEADKFIKEMKAYDVGEMSKRHKYKKYIWNGQWKVKVKSTPYHIKI